MHSFAKSIVETLQQPLLILDERLVIIVANAPFHQSFQTTAAEVTGQSVLRFDKGRWDHPQLRTLQQNVLLPVNLFIPFEMDYDSEVGEQRRLSIHVRLVNQDDGIRRILVAIEDLTEIRCNQSYLVHLNMLLERRVAEHTAELQAANRQLRDSNIKLAASNRELDAFCYSISHDLRVPLRAIDGFSNELSQSYHDALDDQARHYLGRIRHGTQRMGQLIDDLLKLSRVTRDEKKPTLVNVTAIAVMVADDLARRLPGRKVTFTIHPGLTAWADRQLIQIIFENLLENAWKFTGKTENAEIEFGREKLEFFVKDNGAGFDPTFASNLFGAFQRLHSEREFPGTGIGLATVQRIIHRHGGEIRAVGAVGLGATFYFTLPDSEEGQ